MTTEKDSSKSLHERLGMDNEYAPALLNTQVKGKTIDFIELVNERLGRSIDIYFADKTCLSFSLVVTMTGFMKLWDTGSGDFENPRHLGRIPDEDGIYDGEKDDE